MLFTALDHPAISCYDVGKLADWYCQHLGMKIVGDDAKTPPSLLLGYGKTAQDGTTLELMPVKNAGTAPAEQPRFCPGLRHLAVRVSDFDQAYARLKEAGVVFLFEPVIAVGGGKIVSFRDPEGNELQIVQR
jgi:catechol 2,3-dioxygenase-like lactoylglutathione lyase family enzyme